MNEWIRGHRTHQIYVRPQIPAWDLALGAPMNARRLISRGSAALLYLVQAPNTHADAVSKGLQRAGKANDSHDPKLDIMSNKVKSELPIEWLEVSSNHRGMNTIKAWPQAEFFRSLVDNWLEANPNVNESKLERRAALARSIGIAPSSLSTAYSNKREPGKGTLVKIAAFFQVPLSSLTYDPGAPVPGLTSEDLSTLSPVKHLVMTSIAQKIGPDSVSDESAVRVWKAIADLISDDKIPPRQ